jgi:hypothetical protein
MSLTDAILLGLIATFFGILIFFEDIHKWLYMTQ